MVNFPILPPQASTFAERVDPMFWAITVFVGVFCIAITGIFVYLGMQYPQRHDGRRSEHTENMALEIWWSIIPTVIALGLFWWGAVLYWDYAIPPDNAMDVNVIGKQWMWKLQHPNGMREVNELHIPLNKPVKLTMTSQDVIHCFAIPAFRVKQDVIPAHYTQMWFQATKTGTYPIYCAQYCGTQHSTMVGWVDVMAPTDYEQWLSGGPALSPAAAGEALFTQMGCATCHAAGAANRGPKLDGLFGSQVKLKSGETVLANEEYLRESILKPSAKVVDGFAPLMPTNFGTQLKDEDVLNLIAYIKSLTKEAPSKDSAKK